MSQVVKKFVGTDQVDDTKIKLQSGAYLRSRNNGNTADINVIRTNASDKIEFPSLPQVSSGTPSANQDLITKGYADATYSTTTGANTTLSNLGTTSVNSDLLPSATATRSFGSATLVWLTAFIQTLKDASSAVVTNRVLKSSAGVSALDFSGTTSVIAQDLNPATTDVTRLGSPTLAYTVANISRLSPYESTISLTLGATSGSNVYTTASTTGVTGGMEIIASGVIPRGSFVQSFITNTSITLSSATGAAGAQALTTNASVSAIGTGFINIRSGNQTTTTPSALSLVRSGSTANADSGPVIVTSGAATGTGATGDVRLQSGPSTSGASGNVYLQAGTAGTTQGSVFVVATALDMGSKNINNLLDPTTAQQAATKAYVDANASAQKTWNKENLTLSGTDITNQYKDFAQVAINNSVTLSVNGVEQYEGLDYSLNYTGGTGGKTRLTFLGDLATGGNAALVSGDILRLKYQY
jgi:hypothetical protein